VEVEEGREGRGAALARACSSYLSTLSRSCWKSEAMGRHSESGPEGERGGRGRGERGRGKVRSGAFMMKLGVDGTRKTQTLVIFLDLFILTDTILLRLDERTFLCGVVPRHRRRRSLKRARAVCRREGWPLPMRVWMCGKSLQSCSNSCSSTS
jgi:hypothetical protein